MSRSGYVDDDGDDPLNHGRWRGAVASSIRGKRGQAFLRDLVAALEAMPVKRLIVGDLERGDQVCALGAVGRVRGMALGTLDPEDADQVGRTFGIAAPLAREVVHENDDTGSRETPEERWIRMHAWAVELLGAPKPTRKKRAPPAGLV